MTMKKKWTNTRPMVEGWYLWRRAATIKDPWKWNAYYVMNNSLRPHEHVELDGKGNPVLFSCWEAGTEVVWPCGGWWAAVHI